MTNKQPSGGSASVIERGSSIFSTIMLLAWPILMEQLLMTMVSYADTAMVGVLGANATAAVAINSSSINMVNGLCMAIGVGFTALVARSIGAGNIERARALTGQALIVVVGLGVFFTTLMLSLSRYIPQWMGGDPEILPDARAYLAVVSSAMLFRALATILSAILRGAGDTRTPLVANIISNAFNIAGNFFLIYNTRVVTVFGVSFKMWGAGLGVLGAAIPTAGSIVITGLIVLYVVFARESPVKLDREISLRPNMELLRPAFRISLPTMGERMAMSVGQMAVTYIVTSLGTISLAAHHLAITAEALCFMPAFAFSSAATTLVGQSLGAKREDLADKLSWGVIKITTAALGVAGCILYLGATPLIRIFTNDPLVIPLAAECLRIVAFSQPLTGISMSITGVLRGAGDTKWPLIVVLVSMWSLRITLAYILCIQLDFGLQGMWYCMVLDFGLRSLILSLRYRSGKWKHVMKDHDDGALIAEFAE